MQSKEYMENAARTVSDQFHGELIPQRIFVGAIRDFIEAGERLDVIKKALFYGKSSAAVFLASDKDMSGLTDPKMINIAHAILGVCTESVEMLQALVSPTGKVDTVNLREEGGDVLWYQALLFEECDTDFEAEMARNIAKLRKRFPDKFTEDNANNRDLDGERKVLEDNMIKGEKADSMLPFSQGGNDGHPWPEEM